MVSFIFGLIINIIIYIIAFSTGVSGGYIELFSFSLIAITVFELVTGYLFFRNKEFILVYILLMMIVTVINLGIAYLAWGVMAGW
jgi:hypothetical protein